MRASRGRSSQGPPKSIERLRCVSFTSPFRLRLIEANQRERKLYRRKRASLGNSLLTGANKRCYGPNRAENYVKKQWDSKLAADHAACGATNRARCRRTRWFGANPNDKEFCRRGAPFSQKIRCAHRGKVALCRRGCKRGPRVHHRRGEAGGDQSIPVGQLGWDVTGFFAMKC